MYGLFYYWFVYRFSWLQYWFYNWHKNVLRLSNLEKLNFCFVKIIHWGQMYWVACQVQNTNLMCFWTCNKTKGPPQSHCHVFHAAKPFVLCFSCILFVNREYMRCLSMLKVKANTLFLTILNIWHSPFKILLFTNESLKVNKSFYKL